MTTEVEDRDMESDGFDYHRYCVENRIDELFGIEVDATSFDAKVWPPYAKVDPENLVPSPPELGDLVRLHQLVRSRRVTTVLEFGVGMSTRVLAHALHQNRHEFGDFVAENLRRSNPFELHSVDASPQWIETCQRDFPTELLERVTFNQSDVAMASFNGRACTLYDQLPNICPDLIYLDGPDQYAASGDVQGISTRHADRLPMSADILVLEPFLLPGTFVLVDGRTANARFLKHNLQGGWRHEHRVKEDVHTFELVEPPLGVYNERQIRFCLGEDWRGLPASG